MITENLTYDQFCSYFPVSRETHEKLVLYVSLLEKWQKSVNLISNATLPHIWKRHIIDSYQLVSQMTSSEAIMDLGSGAGLPGIVLAVAGYNVTMVESDGKKVAFLREMTRVLELDVKIAHQRVEDVDITSIAAITARAFASIADILKLVGAKLTASHRLLLLKGKAYEAELAEAQKHYTFDVKTTPSITDSTGVILLLNNIQQRGAKPV